MALASQALVRILTLGSIALTLSSIGLGCTRDESSVGDAGADASRLTGDARAPSTDADGEDASDAAASDGAATPFDGDVLDPGVISISSNSILEMEPTIAVAPDGRAVVAWISAASSGFVLGATFSPHLGQGWSAIETITSSVGRNLVDPVLVAEPSGTIDLVYLEERDGTPLPVDSHIMFRRSSPGSSSFDDPVEITAPTDTGFNDKPWMTVLHSGALLVTWARAPSTSQNVMMAATSTDGRSWSSTVVVDDGTFHELMSPCADPLTDRVWVVSFQGFGSIHLRRSDDGGRTWPSQAEVPVSIPAEEPVAFDDPRCASDGSGLWVSYGTTTAADQFNPMAAVEAKLHSMVIAHSGDGGRSFDLRKPIQDLASGPLFMHPQMVREANGTLDLAYYSARAAEDTDASFRFMQLDGNAAPLGPSETIHQPLLFEISERKRSLEGDYVGLAAFDGNVYTVYTDNETGTSHIAFQRRQVRR
jgi:hypothetical protein